VNQRDHWMEQIERYADGQLAPAEVAALSAALGQDAALRRDFIELLNLDSAIDELVIADHSPHDFLAAGLQAEADATASPSASPLLPDQGRFEGRDPPNSPILGFLGDVGRQGWRFAAYHVLFSALAVLVFIAAMVTLAMHNGRQGAAQRVPGKEQWPTGGRTADLKSQIGNLKSQVPSRSLPATLWVAPRSLLPAPCSQLPAGYPLGGSPLPPRASCGPKTATGTASRRPRRSARPCPSASR
jgi:hypothetical protein